MTDCLCSGQVVHRDLSLHPPPFSVCPCKRKMSYATFDVAECCRCRWQVMRKPIQYTQSRDMCLCHLRLIVDVCGFLRRKISMKYYYTLYFSKVITCRIIVRCCLFTKAADIGVIMSGLAPQQGLVVLKFWFQDLNPGFKINFKELYIYCTSSVYWVKGFNCLKCSDRRWMMDG